MYYDGTKLLSLKDINNKTPEIFICTSNRTAGKTTYFNRLVVNRFIKYNKKFMLLYRFNYELDNIDEKFFKDIKELFFPKLEMTTKRWARGVYIELFINKKSCGYAVSINSADQIKKYSHIFNDVTSILFDEFQSESNTYCSNEIEKFFSIHTSVARGQGKQVRYVPVYMISNLVSLLNPYYSVLNISSRLNKNVKFLRGDGFVLEQGFNNSASKAQEESAFNRAFASTKYAKFTAETVYLNDNDSFIENLSGQNKYICTIRYNGTDFAIREYAYSGFMYCDKNVDRTFPTKICTTVNDHDINYVMLKNNSFMISNLRYLFEHGCFRFKDLSCKEALINTISY